jgi:NAD(P)-dependent dehydrogenase (short-subunit alcohol dehydrogenase family)
MEGMKTALVTGGAKRIGAAIARALASDGWQVVIHYRTSAEEAEDLAASIRAGGGRAATVRADLADAGDVTSLITDAGVPFGPIGLLINNASAFRYDTATTSTIEQFDEHVAANLRAPIFLAQHFHRQLPKGTPGVIINILDQKTENLNPDFFTYTISKFGLHGATKLLAMALAPEVRVCGISPGVTLISGNQTPESFRKSTEVTPLRRSSEITDIVAAVRFIISVHAMTGSIITIDGGEQLRRRPRDVAFDVD